MSQSQYDLGGKAPLPPIDGPRLAPFKHRNATVDFQELLSSPPDDRSNGGGDAYVFRVYINGKAYALKVFKFYSVRQGRMDIFPHLNHNVDDITFAFQLDPFFAECRAYGKIQQLERERAKRLKYPALAVPCYGFLGLSAAEYEDMFRQKFGITDWNRLDSDDAQPVNMRHPFRALVKQLVDTGVGLKNGRKMLNDLNFLRRNGIYQRDVHERNYLDGLLVDFSIAWTEPLWFSTRLTEDEIDQQTCDDLLDWDDMVARAGLKTRMRAVKDRLSMNSADQHQRRYKLRKRRPR